MMRSPSSQNEPISPETADRPAHWASRTAADYSSLLLELARAQRGYLFYPETDGRRRPLADRAHRALASELRRAGPIDLRCVDDADGTRFVAGDEALPIDAQGPMAELVATWLGHGVERLRFDEDLTPTALAALLDLLGRPAAGSPDPEGVARALAARDDAGLRINAVEKSARSDRPALGDTPLHARASLTSAPLPVAEPDDAEDETKPVLDVAPLAAMAGHDAGERLRARLIELDATAEDDAYHARLLDIAAWTEDIWAGGHHDDAYRTLLVLADHAIGAGGRSETQARAAALTFRDLAHGEVLEDLIDRSTAPGTRGIRAAQLLLQLGESAVPSILGRLAGEADESRSAPLRALILIQGETALGAVLDAIRSQDTRRALLGLRLAGELQNPLVLPALLNAVRGAEPERRIEAVRALGFLPGDEAQNALLASLSSDLDELAAAAARALAGRLGEEAISPLLSVLESSVQQGRTALACALVEVLGRIGDERAVPRLCALLDRKPLLRRAHWHSIQLVTVDALATLPTREARRCIDRASRHATQSIRARARDVLARLDERGR